MPDVGVRKLLRDGEGDEDYPVWSIYELGRFKTPALVIEELEFQHLIKTYLTEHPKGREWVERFIKEQG